MPAVRAVILCAASMILGFISLVTASVPAVRSLGIAMGFGTLACLIGTLLLLAPLLLKDPGHRSGQPGGVEREQPVGTRASV